MLKCLNFANSRKFGKGIDWISPYNGLIVFVLLALVFFHPFLGRSPAVNIDGEDLLGPLVSIHGLQDWWNAYAQHRILDLQPVRDLTFLVDIFIQRHFSWDSFIVQNLFWWSATTALLVALYSRFFSPSLFFQVAVVLWCLFPTFTVSLCWISSRKNLLAFFFLVLASSLWLKFASLNKPGWKWISVIGLAYLFSLLSQPVFLFWPLWAWLYLYQTRRWHLWRYLLPLLILLPVMGALNIFYYQVWYAVYHAAPMVDADWDWGLKIMSLGRSFWQIVFPWKLASTYDRSSPLNFLGLSLMVFYFYALFKKFPRREALLWMGGFLLPFPVVLLKTNNIFVSDTYLLAPALCVWAPLIIKLCQLKQKKMKVVLLLLAALLIFPKTWREIRQWDNAVGYFQHSYAQEKTCENAVRLEMAIFLSGKEELPATLLSDIMGRKCLDQRENESRGRIHLLSFLIYYEKEMSIEEKIRQLEKLEKLNFYPALLKAALLLSTPQWSEGLRLAADMLSRQEVRLQDQGRDPVARTFYHFCQSHNVSQCPQILRDLQRLGYRP
jgi:hypothetical protein